MKLHGAFTALVTPMNKDGSVDFGALDALVDTQLKAGINGLVPCGTTGETATLELSERDAVVAAVRVLEDDPEFGAGIGSALTRDGTVETCASVMDGARRKAGAVAAMQDIGAPVRSMLLSTRWPATTATGRFGMAFDATLWVWASMASPPNVFDGDDASPAAGDGKFR